MRGKDKHTSFSPGLPPIELRRDEYRDPLNRHFEHLPTPVTEIGLVDRSKLIRVVNDTLHSPYEWPTDPDEHHLQWPARWYPYEPDGFVNPHKFRNNAMNKAYWMRSFHNWAHRVTEPPAPPSLEVMYHADLSQTCIDGMYRAAQTAKMLARNPQVTPERQQVRFHELLDDFREAHEQLARLPAEFHFVDPSNYTPETTDHLLTIDGSLGRLATTATVSIVARHVRQRTKKAA